jgi:FkbM family methyltransferase
MTVYIQIGAGAGDLDVAANYRDGFTTLIKHTKLGPYDRVVVVEPNPLNSQALKQCWKDYPKVEIHSLAINAGNTSESFIDLYYAKEDFPNFQVSSLKREHVEKFYPGAEIHKFVVPSVDINSFLELCTSGEEIELLALDIEGLDLEVIDNLDFIKFKIHQISFEKTHGGPLLSRIEEKLKKAKYRRAGSGMDPHNSDVLWVKPQNEIEKIKIFCIRCRHWIWEIQIPLRHRIKKKLNLTH